MSALGPRALSFAGARLRGDPHNRLGGHQRRVSALGDRQSARSPISVSMRYPDAEAEVAAADAEVSEGLPAAMARSPERQGRAGLLTARQAGRNAPRDDDH